MSLSPKLWWNYPLGMPYFKCKSARRLHLYLEKTRFQLQFSSTGNNAFHCRSSLLDIVYMNEDTQAYLSILYNVCLLWTYLGLVFQLCMVHVTGCEWPFSDFVVLQQETITNNLKQKQTEARVSKQNNLIMRTSVLVHVNQGETWSDFLDTSWREGIRLRLCITKITHHQDYAVSG